MKPPIRVVCGECLRSVEIVLDRNGQTPLVCPLCGGTIESEFEEASTPASSVTLPLGQALDPEKGVFWSEVLSRGTLGTVGRFMLRDLLGDGGFGQVYKAYDPRLDRDVALKVLRELEPSDRVMQRFFREARAAARLRHPIIVAVHDAGYDDGRCWISFEYVSGCTLSRRLDQQDLDVVSSVRIARDLADALDHAHSVGVYHRDIKPGNVLIDRLGVPHLIDFGLARRADLDSGLTREGSILGTPRYMPPEQAKGRSHLADARSDVYSLGILLFEMLGGRRDDARPSKAAPWDFKPETPPPPLRKINPAAPAALEAICSRALASDPLERYPDAGEFARALDRWLKRRQVLSLASHPVAKVAIGLTLASLISGTVALVFGDLPFVHQAAQVARLEETSDLGSTVHEVKRPLAERTPSRDLPVPIESVDHAPAGAVMHLTGHGSEVYHLPDCKLVAGKKPNLVYYANEQSAKDANFRQCTLCDPKKKVTAVEH